MKAGLRESIAAAREKFLFPASSTSSLPPANVWLYFQQETIYRNRAVARVCSISPQRQRLLAFVAGDGLSMANRTVALLRYCKTESGWFRYPAVIGKTGKVKPNAVLVAGQERVYAEGHYELRYHEGSRAVFKNVGQDPAEALLACQRLRADLEYRRVAHAAGRSTQADLVPSRVTLARARTEFIERKRLAQRDKETISAYEQLTAEFMTVCNKTYADEVRDLDLMRFFEALRKRGLAERTVANYYQSISTFLRFCAVDSRALLKKHGADHRPKYEEKLVEVYTENEVRRFLAACPAERDRLAFEFLLKTGIRENELAHAEWADINWDASTFIVRSKPILAMRTKTRRSRRITIETVLLKKLAAWREKRPNTRFIFGTRSDRPNGHLLETCKETARRAGLNCGHCSGCLGRNECERFYLHKFRATFATWALQRGMDIRTVQQLMGHTSVEMTERYLAPAEGEAAQQKIDGVFASLG